MNIDQLKLNMLVPYYLMASYLYYHVHDAIPIMSDTDFDTLCKRLDKKWDRVKHPHKYIIDRSVLSAGTGFNMIESDYPSITKLSAHRLSEKHKGEQQ